MPNVPRWIARLEQRDMDRKLAGSRISGLFPRLASFGLRQGYRLVDPPSRAFLLRKWGIRQAKDSQEISKPIEVPPPHAARNDPEASVGRKPSWIIRCAAPVGRRGDHWGDLAFAKSLAEALDEQGQAAVVERYGEWGRCEEDATVLLLRGRFRERTRDGRRRFIWLLSHPDDVGTDELRDYDEVLCASSLHGRLLGRQLGRPVHYFPQCTEFGGDPLPFEERSGIVFVGNSRFVERRSLFWALDLGLPVQIWGQGWEGLVPAGNLKGSYLDRGQLRHVYSRARVVLNDHWDDMRRWGYVNNRIYDAIACGTPVLSDGVVGAAETMPEGVIRFSSHEEFEKSLDALLRKGMECFKLAQHGAQRVTQEFSFASRVKPLLDLRE